MFSYFRNRRRRQLLAEPFPPGWVAILNANVGHYTRLSPAEKARLRGDTRVIVAETVFGKGVSYMESQIAWHYMPMSDEQFAQALGEVEAGP